MRDFSGILNPHPTLVPLQRVDHRSRSRPRSPVFKCQEARTRGPNQRSFPKPLQFTRPASTPGRDGRPKAVLSKGPRVRLARGRGRKTRPLLSSGSSSVKGGSHGSAPGRRLTGRGPSFEPDMEVDY